MAGEREAGIIRGRGLHIEHDGKFHVDIKTAKVLGLPVPFGIRAGREYFISEDRKSLNPAQPIRIRVIIDRELFLNDQAAIKEARRRIREKNG